MRACVRAFVRAPLRACVRVCVCACVCACVCTGTRACGDGDGVSPCVPPSCKSS